MKSLDITIIILILLHSTFGWSQPQDSVQRLTLSEVVQLTRSQSVAARQAQTTLDTRFWEWRTFQAGLRPQLLLQGNLPDFTRTNQEVIQPDGTVEFQSVTINNSGLSLGLEQQIASTGGTIYASTVLQRFDDFDRGRTIYNSQPFTIGYDQPLFGFNALRWDKKIEPLWYEESQKQFLMDQEDISLTATQLFFDLLLAQVNLQMAQTNLANNDTLYRIAQERTAIGRLSRNDLLQLQLGVLTARKDVATSRQDLATARLRLQAFTGIREEALIELDLPLELPAFKVEEAVALQQAWQNRPEVTGFRRRQLEAEQEVARARGETGIEASLTAAFGFSNKATNLGSVYLNPQDQEMIRLQFSIPLVDWGRASSRRETARANQLLTETTLEQDRLNFEQEVRTQVNLYNMLREQLELSREADGIAQERYTIARERYLLGNLSITDLNLALQEKDRAKRDYIDALRAYWVAYYELRALTLYDFEKGQKLF